VFSKHTCSLHNTIVYTFSDRVKWCTRGPALEARTDGP
jgi:hypothetical protein